MFIRVVLPAPFGPMRPTISPGPTLIAASLRASMPPKRMATWSTIRGGAPAIGAVVACLLFRGPSSCLPMVAKLMPVAARSIAVPGADMAPSPSEAASDC